jgi:hypothetical protein
MRNQSGLCIWCQVEMHLQPASALPGPNTLVCPACAGEATSPRKAAAARKNGKLGGPPMTQRLCRLCKTIHLATHNESGVCRTCQRKYGKPKPEIPLTFT